MIRAVLRWSSRSSPLWLRHYTPPPPDDGMFPPSQSILKAVPSLYVNGAPPRSGTFAFADLAAVLAGTSTSKDFRRSRIWRSTPGCGVSGLKVGSRPSLTLTRTLTWLLAALLYGRGCNADSDSRPPRGTRQRSPVVGRPGCAS
jgi:hypothetical protein